jgi:CTP:molybdopterin cytidylyltransferase MocA
MGVVLAAGRSERIRSITGGGSKALLRLGGLSLVERRHAICWDWICLRSQQ